MNERTIVVDGLHMRVGCLMVVAGWLVVNLLLISWIEQTSMPAIRPDSVNAFFMPSKPLASLPAWPSTRPVYASDPGPIEQHLSAADMERLVGCWQLTEFVDDPWRGFWQFASRFRCESERWCERWYEVHETARVQDELRAAQFPADCNQRRLLVMEREWDAGVGSMLHVKSQYLGVAMQLNRTLVVAESLLTWSKSNFCARGMRRFECYFEPISKCKLDEELMNKLSSLPRLASEWRQQQHADDRVLVVNHTSIRPMVPDRFAHKGLQWWRAQSTSFLSRPNERVKRELWWPTQQRVFAANNGTMPHPIIAMFIRHTDKVKEAQPRDLREYMRLVQRVAEQHNISSIFLSSDDGKVIEQAHQMYPQYRWFTIEGSALGLSDAQMVMRVGIDELMRIVLANLMISVQADVFVGTRSSNFCRLIDEIRKVRGKARVPYLSPEDQIDFDL